MNTFRTLLLVLFSLPSILISGSYTREYPIITPPGGISIMPEEPSLEEILRNENKQLASKLAAAEHARNQISDEHKGCDNEKEQLRRNIEITRQELARVKAGNANAHAWEARAKDLEAQLQRHIHSYTTLAENLRRVTPDAKELELRRNIEAQGKEINTLHERYNQEVLAHATTQRAFFATKSQWEAAQAEYDRMRIENQKMLTTSVGQYQIENNQLTKLNKALAQERDAAQRNTNNAIKERNNTRAISAVLGVSLVSTLVFLTYKGS